MGEGEPRGGNVPSRRVSPIPCCHTKGGAIRVGLKDGGKRDRKDPYEETRYRGAGIEEVRAWWKSCRNWMESYRTYGEPFVFDFKKLLKALSAKDTAAQLEVDIFMENCAKRWQTKDGTYRLKRRRLPDVRDSPGYPGADIDMEDI